MIKPSVTIKSLAQTIITTADVTSDIIEDAGGAVTNLTSGLRHFSGVFTSWGRQAEKEQLLKEDFEVKTMLRDYTAKFNDAEFELPPELSAL